LSYAWAVAGMKRSSRDKIAKKKRGVTRDERDAAPSLHFFPARPVEITVWLHVGGRTFRCPFCNRLSPHPALDPTYRLAGHAYCHWCGMWTKIAGVREPPRPG
jgi:hypothetical protein